MNMHKTIALAGNVRLDDLESDAHHMYQLADTIEDILLSTDFGGDPNALHSPKRRLGALMWILRDRLEQHALAFDALTSRGQEAADLEAPAKRDEEAADAELLRVYGQAVALSGALNRAPVIDEAIDEQLIAEIHRLEASVLDTPAKTITGLAAKVDLVFYRGGREADLDGTDEGKVRREVRALLASQIR